MFFRWRLPLCSSLASLQSAAIFLREGELAMKRLALSAALMFAAATAPAAAQDHEFGNCDIGVESVIFSEDLYSPRYFLQGEVTAILFDHASPAVASMGYGLIYWPGEGDGMVCMGQRNFRNVYLEEATIEVDPELGTIMTIPVSRPDYDAAADTGDYSGEVRFEVKLRIDLENRQITLIDDGGLDPE